MSTRRLFQLVVVGAAVAGCATGDDDLVSPILPAVNDVAMANATCAAVGARLGQDLGDFELQVEPAAPGTFRMDDLNQVTVASEDGRYLDWSATTAIDAVLVHAGDTTTAYTYAGEAREGARLSGPINPKTEEPYLIRRVDFCYDHELVVSTASSISLVRTYDWAVGLAASKTHLYLDRGHTATVSMRATVARDGWTDSEWLVRGAIVVTNPAPYPARVTAVADRLGELPVRVTCPTKLPATLMPLTTLVCGYERALPDDSGRANQVLVTTEGYEVGEGTSTAELDFDRAVVKERDARVEVRSARRGVLGLGEGGRFDYKVTVGPYTTCGATELFYETVSVTSLDSGTVTAARLPIEVTVTCCK